MSGKVIVIGSGPVGLIAALGMEKLGYSVEVVYPKTQQSPHRSKPLVLSLSSYRVLNNIGVNITKKRMLNQVRLSSLSAIQSLVCHASDVNAPMLGCIVNGSDLLASLHETLLQKQAITSIDGLVDSITYESDKSHIVLKDGRRYSADLIIAADGKRSAMRQLHRIPWVDAGFEAQALQLPVCFNGQSPDAELRLMSTGTAAFIPSLEPSQGNFIWVHAQSYQEVWSKRINQSDQNELLKDWPMMQSKVQSIDWEQCQTYYCRRKYTTSLVRPGMVLLGDAAMTWEPVGAQMLNLAISDLACLYDCLQSQENRYNQWSALSYYQSLRLSVHKALRQELSYLSNLSSWPIGKSLLIALLDCPNIKSLWMTKGMGYRGVINDLQRACL